MPESQAPKISLVPTPPEQPVMLATTGGRAPALHLRLRVQELPSFPLCQKFCWAVGTNTVGFPEGSD
jgi:hypothetical protein